MVDVVRLSSESEGGEVGADVDGSVSAGVDVDVDTEEDGAIPRISEMAEAGFPAIRFAARTRAR